MELTVTIIIPCRNEEKYIFKCLDSIVNLDFPKENLEVLVCDGMSEDKTLEIIKSFTEKYSYIKLISNEKKIASSALNKCIKIAKGNFITRVDGHAGVISIGECEGKNVAVLRGRFHKYEGYNWRNVISPIFLMKELGTEYLVLTNAAGGINRIYVPGELMLIEDHINFHQMDEDERKCLYETIDNRRDINFYDKDFINLTKASAVETKVKLHEGTYLSLPGPSYETRAEILMFQKMNVDAVGMSTVPEAIWAKALNIKTIGISCITNSTYFEKAMSETSHEEVVTIAKMASQNIDNLLRKIIKELL